ncbi:branched-chain amino acid ABC transporter substrate-binding protein [Coralliovum pocilloporae]|uniref:branched-chain amino acid ABC transporter substrate-binding protein n=1 Tax=Coralliovum pocilloporae TaxID=3066369 RepID=UPI00330702AF
MAIRHITRSFFALLTVLVSFSLPTQAQETLRVGLAAPMSGPFLEFGKQMENGINLAAETVKERGGPDIELVIADDKCTRDGAKAAANQLVGARVDVVIGHVCWGASVEGARIYADADIPQISPATRHPSFTDEAFGKPGLRFRLTGRDDHFGRIAADYLKTLSISGRVAVLHDNSAFGKDTATRLKDALETAGTRPARFEAFQSGLSEYGSLAIQLEADAIDVVFLGSYHADAALIVKALKERGVAISVVGGDAILVDDFLLQAGDTAEGIQAIAAPDPRQLLTDPDLLATFKEKDIEAFALTIPSFVAVELIVSALSANPADLAKGLLETEHGTILGPIRFEQNGDSNLPSFVPYVWRDGAFQHKVGP